MPTTNLTLKSLPKWAVLEALMVAVFASLAWMSEGAAPSKTLENLKTAYLGEANAHVRYLAFADRAQEAEFGEAASLFRAAACAEHVQVKNLAAVLRKMGYEPVIRINTPVVKTTSENLRRSAGGCEPFECGEMYPAFIEQAKAEGNEDAVRAFQFALTGQKQHTKLFKAALNNLHKMDMTSPLYYVCNVRGYTSEHPVRPCPGCSDRHASYVQVH